MSVREVVVAAAVGYGRADAVKSAQVAFVVERACLMWKAIEMTLVFAIWILLCSAGWAEWDDKTVSGLAPEEVALLKEWASEFPRLVEKYSHLSLEYTHDAEQNGHKSQEQCRIFIRDNDHLRWDIDSPEGTQVFLALPGRCYRFAKKKVAKDYVLLSKGDGEESKKMAMMILSCEVVRAPFAYGSIPLWYDFDLLDDPSLEHFWFNEYRASAEDASLKFLSVTEESDQKENRVTVRTESTLDGKTYDLPTVLLRNRTWALGYTQTGIYIENGKESYCTYHREYDGEVEGVPLLKKAWVRMISDKEVIGQDDYLVTGLELSSPSPTVFDPKQFLPPNARGIGTLEKAKFSWGRILLMSTGVLLIVLGIWMKIKRAKPT